MLECTIEKGRFDRVVKSVEIYITKEYDEFYISERVLRILVKSYHQQEPQRNELLP